MTVRLRGSVHAARLIPTMAFFGVAGHSGFAEKWWRRAVASWLFLVVASAGRRAGLGLRDKAVQFGQAYLVYAAT